MRRQLLLLAAAITIGNAHPAFADPCSGLHLKVENGGQDARNGRLTFGYTIRNIGPDTCTLGGHPTIELLDTKGVQLASVDIDEAPPTEGAGKEPLDLEPGDEAHFTLQFEAPKSAEGSDCAGAVELRATLPGTDMPATFAGSFSACGTVTVSPIAPGASPLR